MIIQLYPNEDKFEFEHGDNAVKWVKATPEQAIVFSTLDWLMCSEVDAKNAEIDCDFDIADEGIQGAYKIAWMLLEEYQGEVEV